MSAETDSITSVETAISHVLGAEQDALAQIAACEKRADEITREARQAVREMVRRTQERISRLHAGCAERTRALVAALEDASDAAVAQELADNIEQEILRRVVRRVARELTTSESSDVR